MYAAVCMSLIFLHLLIFTSSFLGVFWKCARIGERKSQYVAVACVMMAVNILFWA